MPCKLLTCHPVVFEIPNTAVHFLFRTVPVLRIPCKHQHSDACCGRPSCGIRVNCTVSRNLRFILPKVTVKVKKVTVIYLVIAQNGYSVTLLEVQKSCTVDLIFSLSLIAVNFTRTIRPVLQLPMTDLRHYYILVTYFSQ